MKDVVHPLLLAGGLPAPPTLVAWELVRMEHRLLALEKEMRRSISRAALLASGGRGSSFAEQTNRVAEA